MLGLSVRVEVRVKVKVRVRVRARGSGWGRGRGWGRVSFTARGRVGGAVSKADCSTSGLALGRGLWLGMCIAVRSVVGGSACSSMR